MVEIVQKENPVLRQNAKAVPISDITSAKIQKIIEDMKKALSTQDDGVAIAAPQINVPLRIFVISAKVYSQASKKNLKKDKTDMVFINPEITSLSKTKRMMDEGCLSVRYLYGKVKRSTKATIKAYNENGHEFTKRGEDLLAQIFQHETDHLNGILFIDSAVEVEDLPPEKIEELKKTTHEHNLA
jgi:peptide deformylase